MENKLDVLTKKLYEEGQQQTAYPHNILNANLNFILFCSSFQVIVNGLT